MKRALLSFGLGGYAKALAADPQLIAVRRVDVDADNLRPGWGVCNNQGPWYIDPK